MVHPNDYMTDVPGTVYLVDASQALSNATDAGPQEIVLIPQPSSSPADPLNWPRIKKLWSLLLISFYACVFSFGGKQLGCQLDVNLRRHRRFFNIIWIPTAMKIGRKVVYILSLLILLGGSVWGGFYTGTGQYYIMLAIQGIGTAAYQAVIQLTGVLILLFIFTFDDTMFPRYRFTYLMGSHTVQPKSSEDHRHQDNDTPTEKAESKSNGEDSALSTIGSHRIGEDIPIRSYRQKISLIHYFADDETTWFQYFRRPFYLFAFPNIVIAGIQFAFGCTAGIVSFNTISEIMTDAPYNWSAGTTGLIFLAALVGNFIGMGIGALSDWVVIVLARRNKGYKEPEMRVWACIFPFIFGAVGYFTYGWAATNGDHWIAIAVALCCLIAQQVSITSMATAYAMECFDGVSGELVVVLAICSSLINFAISYSVQPFIDATNYGWAFTCFGILVVLSVLMGLPILLWGKSWRYKCKARYEKFLAESGHSVEG
ncbi:hypothetical protein N7468_007742 [Penicillium chermesinum]|uniref:MFS transporter n=1 Tax=Penicillium chermesinum TaxID=63820 RepID=A0A9W9TKR9_9EURO|nr:uncharacterized protein N7468_007742 [Penicillium chermesinum]KAJ5226517.1 hypothetical protein N7468_007742 [Penicillium chermesinum]